MYDPFNEQSGFSDGAKAMRDRIESASQELACVRCAQRQSPHAKDYNGEIAMVHESSGKRVPLCEECAEEQSEINARIDAYEERERGYNVGDRPSSPPAHLLRSLTYARADRLSIERGEKRCDMCDQFYMPPSLCSTCCPADPVIHEAVREVQGPTGNPDLDDDEIDLCAKHAHSLPPEMRRLASDPALIEAFNRARVSTTGDVTLDGAFVGRISDIDPDPERVGISWPERAYPPRVNVEALKLDGGTMAIHEEIVAWADKEITKAIAGPGNGEWWIYKPNYNVRPEVRAAISAAIDDGIYSRPLPFREPKEKGAFDNLPPVRRVPIRGSFEEACSKRPRHSEILPKQVKLPVKVDDSPAHAVELAELLSELGEIEYGTTPIGKLEQMVKERRAAKRETAEKIDKLRGPDKIVLRFAGLGFGKTARLAARIESERERPHVHVNDIVRCRRSIPLIHEPDCVVAIRKWAVSGDWGPTASVALTMTLIDDLRVTLAQIDDAITAGHFDLYNTTEDKWYYGGQ